MKLAHVLTEATSKVTKVIALYPGRFQPFGQHHAKAYEWMSGQFGKSKTYVATSNVVDAAKSPFTFADKKKIIGSYGITRVGQVKNPYKAEEIVKRFDKDTTAIVFGFGAKDASRLASGKYFLPYEENKDKLNPYTENGYFVVIPHIPLKVPGYGEMSGTTLRKAFGSKKMGSDKKKKIFKAVFGHMKMPIYNLIVGKLGGTK
jgi:hypothetical protein